LGNLFPAASHPEIALHACAGRLHVMEHGVKSSCKRTFNSYLSDLVSHLK
jgi:hypothetical protein